MKKSILFLLSAIMVLTSCYRVSPDGGQESVLIYKPFFFGHGGVDSVPVSAGATWCAPTTDHVEFPIIPQDIEYEQNNVMTKDNTPLDVYSDFKYQIIKGSTPELYEKFGSDWFNQSISSVFYSMIRNKCSQYKMFDLASDRSLVNNVEQNIYDSISLYTKQQGIPINILQIVLTEITPPQEVLNETKKTAAQNQNVLTEQARAQSELARKQADINKAIADQAYQQQMGMSIDQYLKLRELELIENNPKASIIFTTGIQPTYNTNKN